MLNNTALTPRIKYWEAIGAVADGRVTIRKNSRTEIIADVASSTLGKKYRVSCRKSSGAWSSNDNGSYWRGYIGYPIISVMMHLGLADIPEGAKLAFAGIEWKVLNQRLKNNYEDVEKHLIRDGSVTVHQLDAWQSLISGELKKLNPRLARPSTKPPAGF